MANIYETLRSNFSYIQPGEVATFNNYVGRPQNSTWFLIEDLDQVRLFLKRKGMTFTPRFRGPRSTVYNVNSIGRQYYRSEFTRKSTCLKDDAKFFSVASVKSY